MGQWSKCYNCKNVTDKCRIELCQKDNDDCDNYEVKEMDKELRELFKQFYKSFDETQRLRYKIYEYIEDKYGVDDYDYRDDLEDDCDFIFKVSDDVDYVVKKYGWTQ